MEYKNRLLIEFLMFSNDIEKEILDFNDSINEIDEYAINDIIDTIKNENIYTEQNLKNFQYLLKYLNIDYDELIKNTKPSNDVYYYEYLEKFDVLKKSINKEYDAIPLKLLEDSIRFDFYAYNALISKDDDFMYKFLSNLIGNKLFLLFVKKILNENPDILLNKKIKKRILSVLRLNLCYEDNIDEMKNLKNQVIYLATNKKSEIFDYEKFKYHYNNAFFKYIITDNGNLEKYHDYIISDEFIYYIKEEIEKYDLEEYKDTFSYPEEIKSRIKYILKYILNYRQSSDYKLLYNSLIYKLNTLKPIKQFYNEEFIKRTSFIDIIKNSKCSIEEVKYDLRNEYEILKIYSLEEREFTLSISKINKITYIKWLKYMIDLDINFFNNEVLRNRTLYILDKLVITNESLNKDTSKIKNKILKINKELEY